MSETEALIINEKTEIPKDLKADIISEKSSTVIENPSNESTANLVRNLGATNLLEEGQKLLIPVEAQKLPEDPKTAVASIPSEPVNPVPMEPHSEKSTPRATPRDYDTVDTGSLNEKPNLETNVENLPKEFPATNSTVSANAEPIPGLKSEDFQKFEKEDAQTSEKEGTTQGELFSITGQKVVKVSRHRDQVTCFPSGCMGIPEDEEPTNLISSRGRRFLRASDVQERDSGHLEGVPRRRPPSASVRQANQSRNPLTGEGYIEADFICGHGKHLQPIGKHESVVASVTNKKEEKPEKIAEVTTVEPKESKPKRIPPGGFSSPLW